MVVEVSVLVSDHPVLRMRLFLGKALFASVSECPSSCPFLFHISLRAKETMGAHATSCGFYISPLMLGLGELLNHPDLLELDS